MFIFDTSHVPHTHMTYAQLSLIKGTLKIYNTNNYYGSYIIPWVDHRGWAITIIQ